MKAAANRAADEEQLLAKQLNTWTADVAAGKGRGWLPPQTFDVASLTSRSTSAVKGNR